MLIWLLRHSTSLNAYLIRHDGRYGDDNIAHHSSPYSDLRAYTAETHDYQSVDLMIYTSSHTRSIA